MQYILKGHIPQPCPDLEEWGRFMGLKDERRVALDEFGDIRISTIFLGLDHNFGSGGAPILFETMVFWGPLDGEMDRYSTWKEAETGHRLMVKRVQERLKNYHEITTGNIV